MAPQEGSAVVVLAAPAAVLVAVLVAQAAPEVLVVTKVAMFSGRVF